MIDGHVREIVVREYRKSVAVSAGAGTGKTTLLVNRIVAAWSNEQDTIDPSNTLAITFTRAAALEMRMRLRYAMQKKAEEMQSPLVSERAQMVDAAQIGTIHNFCKEVLEEFCMDAGLPPRFTLVSEGEAEEMFQQWWRGFLRHTLADANAAHDFNLLLDNGASLDRLYQMARSVEKARLQLRDADRSPLETGGLNAYREAVAYLREQIGEVRQECDDEDDKLNIKLQEFEDELAKSLQERLNALPKLSLGSNGKKGSWKRDPKEIRTEIKLAYYKPMGAVLQRFALMLHDSLEDFANERAQRGTITTDDLLTLAHDLICGNEAVGRAICRRYPNIYLDEVQDTDPIQSRIMIALSQFAKEEPALGTGGGLSVFVVGDIEQSIYGFRGASPFTFTTLIENLGLEKLPLVTNFRCHGHIIEWVNPRFLEEEQYLHAGLDLPVGETTRVCVTGIPDPERRGKEGPRAAERRQAEARAIATYFYQAKTQGWQIRDGDGSRAADWQDMVVLCKARTAWPHLMEAFDELGIPYVTQVEALLYDLPEFAELMEVLTAIADPDDHVASIAAGKSAFLRVTDDDLLKFAINNDTYHPTFAHESVLKQWREMVRGLSPTSALIRVESLLEPLVIGSAASDPIKAWNRYRRVFQLAHAQVSNGAGSLLAVAQRLPAMRSQGEKQLEVVGAQDDANAVRLMTVHGSKGLEYPVVAVSGFLFGSRQTRDQTVGVVDGEVAVDLDDDLTTSHGLYDDQKEKAKMEERRLLYVACTRARDYLLVSVHGRSLKTSPNEQARDDAASPFAEFIAALESETEYITPTDLEPIPLAPQQEFDLPEFTPEELQPRAWPEPEILETQPEDEEQAQESAAEDEGEVKGNFGAAIGRAVHATLYTCDLSDPASADALAAFHAESEGVGDLAHLIAQRARSAMDSPLVQAATNSRSHRELYIGTWVESDGTARNRYIDLLYKDGDRYILVDYKTDDVKDSNADFVARKYESQIRGYADTLKRDHNIEIAEAHILFVSQNPAVSVRIL